MEKVRHLSKSVMVLVEWPPERFEGWAKLVGAYNALTSEVMESGLSADGMKILEQIVFQGYNGWHDSTAERMTLSCLDDLAASQGYDRELMLAYARIDASYHGSIEVPAQAAHRVGDVPVGQEPAFRLGNRAEIACPCRLASRRVS
jgi:hypothetical protein